MITLLSLFAFCSAAPLGLSGTLLQVLCELVEQVAKGRIVGEPGRNQQ
jgi:hypothetical protein